VVEDIIDVLFRGPVAGDRVLVRVEADWVLNRALLRERIPGGLRDCLLAPTPPLQLSQVRQYDSRSLDISRGGDLRLDVLDEADGRALFDSTLASDDAVCEDAEILRVLVEENDHSFLVFDVGRDEDGDVGLGFLCTKG